MAGGPPRTRCGHCSARGNRRCSRCRRGRRSLRADYREACRVALRAPIRRAWSRSSFSCSRRKSARWTAAARRRRAPRAGVRGASRGRVLAPQRRRALDQPKKVKGRATSRARAAPPSADGAGFRPPWSNGTPPKGAAHDDLLDALACAAVGAAHPCGRRAAVSRSAASATGSDYRWRSGRKTGGGHRPASRKLPCLASRRYAPFAWIRLRLIRHSAIWMALSAAPLRRLSDTHHSTRPFSTVASSRMRLI